MSSFADKLRNANNDMKEREQNARNAEDEALLQHINKNLLILSNYTSYICQNLKDGLVKKAERNEFNIINGVRTLVEDVTLSSFIYYPYTLGVEVTDYVGSSPKNTIQPPTLTHLPAMTQDEKSLYSRLNIPDPRGSSESGYDYFIPIGDRRQIEHKENWSTYTNTDRFTPYMYLKYFVNQAIEELQKDSIECHFILRALDNYETRPLFGKGQRKTKILFEQELTLDTDYKDITVETTTGDSPHAATFMLSVSLKVEY